MHFMLVQGIFVITKHFCRCFSLQCPLRRNHHAMDHVTFSNLQTRLVRTIMIGKGISGFFVVVD